MSTHNNELSKEAITELSELADQLEQTIEEVDTSANAFEIITDYLDSSMSVVGDWYRINSEHKSVDFDTSHLRHFEDSVGRPIHPIEFITIILNNTKLDFEILKDSPTLWTLKL